MLPLLNLKIGSKLSLNHVSAIACSQVRESYRKANIIGVSSLVNRSNFIYYTVERTTLNLLTKKIPSGTYTTTNMVAFAIVRGCRL